MRKSILLFVLFTLTSIPLLLFAQGGTKKPSGKPPLVRWQCQDLDRMQLLAEQEQTFY